MATINSNDVLVYLIPETTYGELAIAGNKYELPRKQGAGLLTKDYGAVASDTIRPGRNANGSRRGNETVSGTIELNAITSPVVDLLLESAASAKFDSNGVLKAAKTDISFTHVAVLSNGQYQVSTGCMVTGATLNAQAADAVTYSFEVTGSKQVEQATLPNGYTEVAIDDAAYEYLGHEVLNVTVAGTTALKFSELELQVNQARNARNILSSNTAAGLTVSGAREVTETFTFYREAGVDYEAIFTGEPQEFAFDLGIAAYGRSFTVFGQAAGLENNAEDDLMITITVTGKYDSTTGTALVIEKL